jgi:hypothetical protein
MSSLRNPLMLSLIGGILTGMGNGSVFGAALMCFLGRGKFDNWGGWYGLAYTPTTFTGFIDTAMIIFGVAFFLILYVAVGRHLQMESKA